MTNDRSRDSAETNEIDVPKGPAGRPRRHCFLFYKSYHTSCIIPALSDRRYILLVVFDVVRSVAIYKEVPRFIMRTYYNF